MTLGQDTAAAETPGETSVDVAVIGAGLAGTATSIVLARAGWRVALVDTHAVHPEEFRAEKMGELHMALFDRLGLGEIVRSVVTEIDGVWIYRFGRLVRKERWREYGFGYASLINGLRANLPPAAPFMIGRVTGIETGPDRQRVTLADGRTVTARLLVVATGLGDTIRRSIGIRRVETRKGHSLSLGFTLAKPADQYPFGSLTYYSKAVGSRFAYLTLFPSGQVMRGNFFVYREAGEAWTKSFRKQPQPMLREMAPEIADLCGGFEVSGPVEVRAIDLIKTEEYERDGVVLVGDAFCTTCPAPGVGIQRVMTDVEQLCTHHVPGWLATPGMGRAKIATYYADPVKRAMDREGIAASVRARALATDTSLPWSFRRLRNDFVRRFLYEGRAILRGGGMGL